MSFSLKFNNGILNAHSDIITQICQHLDHTQIYQNVGNTSVQSQSFQHNAAEQTRKTEETGKKIINDLNTEDILDKLKHHLENTINTKIEDILDNLKKHIENTINTEIEEIVEEYKSIEISNNIKMEEILERIKNNETRNTEQMEEMKQFRQLGESNPLYSRIDTNHTLDYLVANPVDLFGDPVDQIDLCKTPIDSTDPCKTPKDLYKTLHEKIQCDWGNLRVVSR